MLLFHFYNLFYTTVSFRPHRFQNDQRQQLFIDIALGLTAIALVPNITRGYETNFENIEEEVIAAEPTSDYQQNLQTLEEPTV